MRQMAAVRKIHPQDAVAVLDGREIDGHVRLRAAVRLHISVVCAKQFLCPIDCGLLDDVSPFAAAVITLTGITFRVLVGKN